MCRRWGGVEIDRLMRLRISSLACAQFLASQLGSARDVFSSRITLCCTGSPLQFVECPFALVFIERRATRQIQQFFVPIEVCFFAFQRPRLRTWLPITIFQTA